MISEIAIVLLLLLLNGFFAMSELAIVSARKARLKQLSEKHAHGARLAMLLVDDPTTFLSIVQIGMTVNSVLAGAFSGATIAMRFADYFNSYSWIAPYGETVSLTLTVTVVTYLNLVFGELLPKRIGLAYAEHIAVRVSPFVSWFVKAIAPVVWLLKSSTDLALRVLHLHKPQQVSVTEDEVKDLLAEGTVSGVFKPAEKQMIEGVMRLADRTVRTIMTPRVNMVWLSSDDTQDEHVRIIHDSGYSRYPVARGDLEEVHGVIYAKDLLNAIFEGRQVELDKIMRPPLTIPDTTPVLRLLDQFKQSGQHVAIIIDEYGSVEGVVTSTDILEAITGDLPELGRDSDEKPVQREDGSWLLDGMMPLDEVEMLLGLKNMRDGGDYHTLAGFIIEQLGRIPSAGDHFEWCGTRFEVVDMDSRRVDKVIVSLPLKSIMPVDQA